MQRLFGPERLAEQIGNRVAERIYRWSTRDYAKLGPQPGTTPIERLFFHSLETYAEYGDGTPHFFFFALVQNSRK